MPRQRQREREIMTAQIQAEALGEAGRFTAGR